MKKIRPIADRLVVRTRKVEKTPGGLLIPETARADSVARGEVLAAGDGWRTSTGALVALNVRVGDVVLFSPHAGNKVGKPGDEDEIVILREADVLGVEE